MTTYYVDTVLGDDGNAGTSEGAGNAWATIDKAMNTVAAGDLVYVKASGSYQESLTIDTAGTNAAPIIFEGYTSTPGDNGKATVDGNSIVSVLLSSVPTVAYYIFKNLIFTNATSSGIGDSGLSSVAWFNCEFTNNGANGVLADNDNAFINCIIANNGANGTDLDLTCSAIGCEIYGNGSAQWNALTWISFCHNLVYGHSSAGFDIVNLGGAAGTCANNTIDGEGVAAVNGIDVGGGAESFFFNNILYDIDSKGVNLSATPLIGAHFQGFNLMNSVTTPYTASVGFGLTGEQDVTSAPGFTDEAGDDYTLDSASPAKNAGIQPGGIT